MGKFGIAGRYTDYREMLAEEKPDFVDIITPPPTHLEMCRAAADLGIPRHLPEAPGADI